MNEFLNTILHEIFFIGAILFIVIFYIFIKYYYNNLIPFFVKIFKYRKKNNKKCINKKVIYDEIYSILEHLLEDHNIKIARIFEFTNGVDFSSRFGYNKLNLTFNLIDSSKRDYNIRISDNIFCSIVWKGFLEYFFKDDINTINIYYKENKYFVSYNNEVLEKDRYDSIDGININYPFSINIKGKDTIYVFDVKRLDRTVNLYVLGENNFGEVIAIPILIDNHIIGLIVLLTEDNVLEMEIEKIVQIVDHINMIINIYHKVYIEVMKGIKFLYFEK